MKRGIGYLVIVLLLASCAGTKNIPEGAPPRLSDKKLREKYELAQNKFRTLEIRGNGHFEDASTSQGFRFQIRLIRDSLIWVDIADPILGIKAARAVLYGDSVAFINRLQKEYFTGPLSHLQKRLNMEFGFDIIQAILGANIAFVVSDDFETYYQPGYYLLADHIPGNTENIQATPRSKFHEITLDPVFFKPALQKLEEPGRNRVYELRFLEVKPQGELLYPEKIGIRYTEKQSIKLDLEIRNVEKDQNLNYPFSIPGDYAQMR